MLKTPSIDASTQICAVFGHPIRHSASPAMHNAAIQHLGLNWRYLAFDVHPHNLKAAIDGAKTMGFIGINLTVPHKLLAMPMVDYLDESARNWGAVNTIRFETETGHENWQSVASTSTPKGPSRSHGFNTDAEAIIRALREDLGFESPGSRVLISGAGGGAGRVAALKLASEGVDALFLINRTAAKAETLAEEIRSRFPMVKTEMGYPQGQVDLLLNATSLGLNPNDPLPVDEKKFSIKNAKAVYDMVYRPNETMLLRRAREEKCRSANGLGMLLHQGAKAFEIWSEKPAPIEVMRQALLDATRD